MSWKQKFSPTAASAILAVVVLALMATGAWMRRPRSQPAVRIDPTYETSIEPIFARRCVACHACYDSPCQLTLQSYDGLDRGANKAVVYSPERTTEATPTRMFQDAKTTSEWQSTKFDFFPVVDHARSKDLSSSMLWRFVNQRTTEPRGGSFDVDKTTACPRNAQELDKELNENPERGMPFGFPPLSTAESEAIAAWLRRGAGGPATSALDDSDADNDIAKWENFLNGHESTSDARTPLVAAYLFEHLFYAHLHFDSAPSAWFRVVRSRTKSGSPIDEIATRRPFDDPGSAPYYYRLRRIRETLVEKTHAPYQLSDAKLARLRQLFFDPPWTAPAGPAPYDRTLAPNPLIAFAAIPARSRYQFLLDDARYFVQAFINGPVCRGQAALDVIQEQFLIFFLAPDSDPSITDAGYLDHVAADLALPAQDANNIDALSPEFAAREDEYLKEQAPRIRARSLKDIWHGDDTRPAVLTVFRHYDNAFVVAGAVGGMPKTACVMDYPILERVYYDLVAGFDVYGNLAHQLGTRLYMNLLRIESEGQFLRLLPTSERDRVHDEWYRGRVAHALAGIHRKAYAGPEPAIAYADPAHAKEEILSRLLTQELPQAVVGPREPIQWSDVPLSNEPTRARFEAAMRGLVNKPAPYVAPFPDTVLLRVKTRDGKDLVYTIARNRSHSSVEFMLSEGVELEPAEDTLQILSGIITGRPNFFLTVEDAELDSFVADWAALKPTDGTWGAFVAKYGARRSDPAFWVTFDFFSDAFSKLDPLGAAVLDLSRYTND